MATQARFLDEGGVKEQARRSVQEGRRARERSSKARRADGRSHKSRSGRSRSRPRSSLAEGARKCGVHAWRDPGVVSSTTLGTGRDEQIVDGLTPEYSKKFAALQLPAVLRPARCASWAPAAARSATAPSPSAASMGVLPDPADFPYTIRLVSDITRVQRLLVDGDGLRRLPRDGRRRPDQAAGRRDRDGARHGGRGQGRSTRSCPTSSASEDHCGDMDFKVAGTQARASPRCRWTSSARA
jgi:hypothetical protein